MISIHSLHLEQGDFLIENISLEIAQGEYCVLMGASGSGKTTVMESICGLRHGYSGKILVAGIDVTTLPPAQRRIAYVPQDGALFPTMTVGEQIAFPQSLHKIPKNIINKTVEELAEQLNITQLLDRYPKKLSGGEKQRVALARALAMDPLAICLDEPLSALDEELHHEICLLLKRIVKERNLTCLHITHSRREALAIADTAYKIDKGQISPFDLSQIS